MGEQIMNWLERLVRDIRYAARSLRNAPAFSAAAILTLALGIGANTAVFSVLHALALSPLPYREPDRLLLILLYNQALKHATALSYGDFRDWQRETRSFENIAAFASAEYDLT